MSEPQQACERAQAFLSELAETPPMVPYEPELLPLLFNATREQSTATLQDIANLVERSQNLAARLLNIANSAYYVLEFKVTSLSRAISVLGLREVRSLVLMVGMVAAIKGVKLPEKFDSRALWQHHIKTAILARHLTAALHAEAAPEKSDPRNLTAFAPDEAYVAGLLHDLGKVFLASTRPGIWLEIEALRVREGCTFAEAENAYWGIDHGLIAAQVLNTWKLPLILTEAIQWHHAPEGRMEASLLSAADTLAKAGYVPGELPGEAVLGLLPPGVKGETLAEALKTRMSGERGGVLASMF
ncbi:MAG: HDOD domain-containing protein [Desulfovibrio sp.]|jgi:HD-like signal output (HDOD) protein|nr:HDOD domain-containing protein [Desulfovibrio sp.]